jgi:uncharacterized protein (DUF305 family)
MRFKLLAAVAAAAALAVVGCGSDDSESAAGGEHNGHATNTQSATAGSGVDRAFVAAMIPHHESAVEMAQIAQKRGESGFVKQLADDIIRTQNAEIATMRREDAALAAEGVKPGDLGVPEDMRGMDHDISMLDKADPFDPAFLEMMIPHHEGAITMANAELAKGADSELKQLAQEIITAQQREIDEMRARLGDDSGGGTDDMSGEDEHSGH